MLEFLAPIAAFGARILPGVFSSVDDFMEIEDNQTKLKEALEEMRAAKLDVEHRIEAETIRSSLKVVKNWLNKVDSATSEAEYLLEKLDGKAAVKYSRKIAKMIEKVNRLNEVGFENINGPNAPLREKMPLPVNFV